MADQLPVGFVPDAPTAPALPAGFIPDRAPDFRSSNDPVQATRLLAQQRAEDEAATEKAKPSWVELAGDAVKGWASGMNPIPLLKAMYDGAQSHYQAAEDAAKRGDYKTWLGESLHHVLAPGEVLGGALIGAQRTQFQKAKKAYDAGRYSEAAGYTAAGVMPFIGPMAAQAGEDIGSGDPRTMARGVGEGVAAARPQLPLEIAGGVMRGAGRVASAAGREVVGRVNLNPAEAASNAFAAEREIPLDAATATGSRWARSAQKMVANSKGGEPAASELIGQQRAALERVGGELAGEVNSDGAGVAGAAVGPEEAAEGVRGSIRQLITSLHDEASKSYGELRKREATAAPDTVPMRRGPVDDIPDWQKRQLRRIVHELDASGYVDATWNDLSQEGGVNDGNAGGGQYERVPRSGGAAVYHDIQDHGGAGMDRGELQASIEEYLGGGRETAAVKGALEVAKQRYQGGTKISAPELPASAFDVPTRLEKARELGGQMQYAVDLTSAKKALTPIRDRMRAGAEIAPLMGAKADAYRALSRLIDGPDHAPLSVVDEALSDLKSMARGGKNGPTVPELRTAGQGTAAAAVAKLDALVRQRAAEAGPEVLQALETGRNMTRGKVAVGDVLDQLREEPVAAFRQLTAPKDAGIKFLRKVREVAPMQMQDVARAWLEQQLELARREGGFGHADRLWSDWNNLGRETKRILFSVPGQTQALDRFFLLAKRISENPNPSGTAHTLASLNMASIPVTAAMAKMLYTKQGVDALTRWMTAAAPTRAASAGAGAARATRAAAWTAVVAAGRRAGLSLPAVVPLAADSDAQR